MPANLLVDIRGNDTSPSPVLGSWTATGSWTTVSGLSATNVTVQSTSSVLIIIAMVPITSGVDVGFDVRLSVNGSPTGSPIANAFSDAGTAGEDAGALICWAVDGLSGSSNSFAVEGILRVGSSPSADATLERSLQVLEIVSGASILVDLAPVSDATNAPAAEADMTGMSDTQTAASGAIHLFLANVPCTSATDARAAFRFAVDGTGVSAYGLGTVDSANDYRGYSGMHVETGVASGSRTFSLRWVDDASDSTAFGSDGTVQRTMQVVEITADASVLADLSSADFSPVGWSVTGTQNDPNLDTDQTTATDGVQLIVAQGTMLPTAGDDCATFYLGVDDVSVSGACQCWSDEVAAVVYGWGCLAHVESGLSAASHSFQVRGTNVQGSPQLDTTFARTLQVLQFTPAAGGAATPKGPLGHPLHGPLAGPIAA